MPTFSRACDVYQGYNYKKDQQTTVGFITKMKIGDTDLDANQEVSDLSNPKSTVKVVSVLSGFDWQTGVTDAVYFSGQIATSNKQKVALLALTDMVKVTVVFNMVVWEFDPIAEKYYKAASVDSDLNGILEKNGSDLNVAVANDPSTEVQSPLNFSFTIGIKPQPSAQKINLATGDQKSVVKAWGLKVG
jgi:hypothetical protein